jgi:hypothetical protein
MTGEALIRGLVMDAIADDYEDLNMVIGEVTEWAKERGVTVAPVDVSDNLRKLVELGLAKAYRLSPRSLPEEIGVENLGDLSAGYYFLLTDDGKRAMEDY